MEGYTTYNIQIPNDRTDLLEKANNLVEMVKNTMQNVKKRPKKQKEDTMTLDEFKSFAGSLSGEFGDMSVDEMRINKALRR